MRERAGSPEEGSGGREPQGPAAWVLQEALQVQLSQGSIGPSLTLNAFQQSLRGLIDLVPDDRNIERDIDHLIELAPSPEELRRLLRDKGTPASIRILVCWVVARLPDTDAVPPLARLLADEGEDEEVREEAAKALGLFDTPAARRALLATLDATSSPLVRQAIVYALGTFGDPRDVPRLVQILVDDAEPRNVRGFAAEALAELGANSAVEPLLSVVKDAPAEVKFWAIHALGEIAGEDAIASLEPLRKSTEVLPQWGSIADEAQDAIERIKSRTSDKNLQ